MPSTLVILTKLGKKMNKTKQQINQVRYRQSSNLKNRHDQFIGEIDNAKMQV